MKEKTLGFIIGGLNLILIIVCVFFFLGKDRTAPVITIEDCNYVYEEDLPVELLYQGVTAYDQEDGDLTEHVVVEKVVADRTNGKATITYGVSDSSGNVGKKTRTLVMPVLTRIQFPNAGEAGAQEEASVTTENQGEAAEETTEGTIGSEGAVTLDETEEENVAGESEDTINPEQENDAENAEEAAEENEESENTENEGEGTTTGGNVTVVGSNNRRN